MVATEHPTFCKQCEALCGVVAHVEDGKVINISADRENPFFRGFVCAKGTNDHGVTNDRDRVVRPLQCQADGSFAEVTWEVALDDISRRLRRIIKTYGGGAVGGYVGNPSVWDYTLFLSMPNFIAGLSLRETRSLNSRLHNVEALVRNRSQLLRMHPADAIASGAADGDVVAVVSRRGRIEVAVKVTDEMHPGNVALPQGWVHRGGWQRAIAAGGVSYNELTPNQSEDLDPVSGQAWLNGFPVRVEALETDTRKTDPVNAPNN